jgi:molybdenum cofactor guanylyltransferase
MPHTHCQAKLLRLRALIITQQASGKNYPGPKSHNQSYFMAATNNITGLILAGGEGRRVGNRDKGLILLEGKPLITHVSDRLLPQVGELLISCNRNFSRYKKIAAQTVADTRRDFQGPLAGMEAAYPYIQTEFLVVVGCDMPHLPPDLVSRLTAPLVDGGAGAPEISYAHDGVREQYLCAAIRRDCLTSLAGFLDAGHRAVRDWYKSRDSVTIDFSNHRAGFRNYNKLS